MDKKTLDFLKKLEKNNNRPWFQQHKEEFDELYIGFKEFCGKVHSDLSKTDLLEPMRVYRIYRDIRFSSDKTPYKNNLSCGFQRATNRLRGGYYFEICPGNRSMAGGGFWSPNPADLKRIRDEFANDAKTIIKITSEKKFKKYFGNILGDGLKNAPRGYDTDAPLIELIKKKQFIVIREFSDDEVLNKNFAKEVEATFKAMRPYFDYMSEVLTTNLNGESIL